MNVPREDFLIRYLPESGSLPVFFEAIISLTRKIHIVYSVRVCELSYAPVQGTGSRVCIKFC